MNVTSYADDFTASCSARSVSAAEAPLNTYIRSFENWAARKHLAISAPKSHSTLFTPDFHESKVVPNIHIDNKKLPLNKSPKILGVTLDTHFTFAHHVSDICRRATSRINILKALAGTSWGHHKSTILVTYNALIRSLITFNTPVWFPTIATSHVQKLQTIQNHALRIATGTVKMSPINHLHNEAKQLPVDSHNSLICKQYLASAWKLSHPLYAVVSSPGNVNRPRKMKHTLQSRFSPDIRPFLDNGVLPDTQYKTTQKHLHTIAVRDELQSQPPQKLLNVKPTPDVAKSEHRLPRAAQSVLSQLRSSYCSSLGAYKHRINPNIPDNCPSCDSPDQDVHHVFNCPSHPTRLSTIDLWFNPISSFSFIKSLPFFPHLADVVLPPPAPDEQ